MKFNNKGRVNAQKKLYETMIVIMVGIFIFTYADPGLHKNFKILEYGSFAMGVYYLFRLIYGRAYFEYDSTGQVLIIKNDTIFKFTLFSLKMKTIEFPKNKLKKYRITNYFIHKTLSIHIYSKHKKNVKLKLNISTISNKRIKYLRQSLNHILKENSGAIANG